MSYQVLARKWRPKVFSELVGQSHVVDAISNALINDRLHHAYLFSGTRGVGKTTIARIFAKSINCERGQGATPCGVCDTCVDINQGRYVDLLEIDAASRTKVEDTRELLDNVQYKPTRGRYKIYLIDEVHMLSKHSFNALLKTLEEPPEHVKFLLATTDPQKLPITVLSRCLQFNLKQLSKEQIYSHLLEILAKEKIPAENEAVLELARSANGSMRDALSLTDQAIAQGNNKISNQIVIDMLGLVDKNLVFKLVNSIIESDSVATMQTFEAMVESSPNYEQMLSQIMSVLHQIALTQVVPEVCKLDDANPKAIYKLSKLTSTEQIQLLYQIALNGKRDLAYAPEPKTGVQIALLRMLAFTPEQEIPVDPEAFLKDDDNSISDMPAEKKTAELPKVAVQSNVSDISKPESKDKEHLEETLNSIQLLGDLLSTKTDHREAHILEHQATVIEDEQVLDEVDISNRTHTTQDVSVTSLDESEFDRLIKPFLEHSNEKLTQAKQIDNWCVLIDDLNVTGMARQLLLNSKLISLDSELKLLLSPKNQHLVEPNVVQTVEDALIEHFNRPVKVSYAFEEIENSPVLIQQRINSMREEHAKQVIEQDEHIQNVLKTFDASIIPDSIKPN